MVTFLSAGDLVAFDLGHPVHHEEGIAVRQDLHHLHHVQRRAIAHRIVRPAEPASAWLGLVGFSGGGGGVKVCAATSGLRICADDEPGQFAIRAVAGPDGHDVAAAADGRAATGRR